jgi:hypothetical protein
MDETKPIIKVTQKDGVRYVRAGDKVVLDGNTYPKKDAIKAAGFQWDKEAKAWTGTLAAVKKLNSFAHDEIAGDQGDSLTEFVPVKSLEQARNFADTNDFKHVTKYEKRPVRAVIDAQNRAYGKLGKPPYHRNQHETASDFAKSLPADEPVLAHSVAEGNGPYGQRDGLILTPKAIYSVSERSGGDSAAVRRQELAPGEAEALKADVELLAKYVGQTGKLADLS